MFRLPDLVSGLKAFLSLLFIASLYHGTQCQAPMRMDEETSSQEPWDKEAFKEEAAQTYNLVFHKYNHRVRPPVLFVEVDVAMTLAHIRHLDIRKQELQTVLNIEADWVDSRLRWMPHKVWSIHSNISSVWYPDIIYTNGVAPVKNLYPNMVRIMSNGAVRWSRKEIVTTQCRTQPEMSTQNCSIELGFLSNTRGDNSDRFFSNKSSVTVLNDFENHEWHLKELEMHFDDNNDTKSTTIRIDVSLQAREDSSTGTGSMANGSNGSGGRSKSQGDNCTTETQYQVEGQIGDKGNHPYLSDAMLLLIMITSLGIWCNDWNSLFLHWNLFSR